MEDINLTNINTIKATKDNIIRILDVDCRVAEKNLQ